MGLNVFHSNVQMLHMPPFPLALFALPIRSSFLIFFFPCGIIERKKHLPRVFVMHKAKKPSGSKRENAKNEREYANNY
jgi:hypothetical protein